MQVLTENKSTLPNLMYLFRLAKSGPNFHPSLWHFKMLSTNLEAGPGW
jgi:hypothetical protein